jgi:hypothetical protein
MPARKPQRARRPGPSAPGAPWPGTRRLRPTKDNLNPGILITNLSKFLESRRPEGETEEESYRRHRRLTEEELKQCKPEEGSFVEFLSRTFPVTERERRYEKLFGEEAKAHASETRSAKRSAKKRSSKARPAKKLRSKRSSSKRSTSRD